MSVDWVSTGGPLVAPGRLVAVPHWRSPLVVPGPPTGGPPPLGVLSLSPLPPGLDGGRTFFNAVKEGETVIFASNDEQDRILWVQAMYRATGQSHKPVPPTQVQKLNSKGGTAPQLDAPISQFCTSWRLGDSCVSSLLLVFGRVLKVGSPVINQPGDRR